ncbi:hypothetical protein ABW21_db0201070 [Orbilia brochopaga]|nr:hypothetical protein ABW21_db0201070 [Drechslerella brochopaga]
MAAYETQDVESSQASTVPRVKKPKLHGHNNITNDLIERAFDLPYFWDKTENWKAIQLPELLRTIKECAKDALDVHKDTLSNSKDFRDQPQHVIECIYTTFIQKIAKRKEDVKQIEQAQRRLTRESDLLYFSVIEDLLAATTTSDRWLFFWAAAEKYKRIFKGREIKAQQPNISTVEGSRQGPSNAVVKEQQQGSDDTAEEFDLILIQMRKARKKVSISNLVHPIVPTNE